MNNREFIKRVYKKYNYFKEIQSKSNEKIEDVPIKERTGLLQKIGIGKRVLIGILIFISASGITYATVSYVKKIFNEPIKYNYNDEKIVTQNDINNSISENEAENKAIKKFSEINEINADSPGNINTSDQNKKIAEKIVQKDPSQDEIYWIIKNDADQELKINAKNGDFISFSDNKLLNQDEGYKLSQEEATQKSKEMFEKIHKITEERNNKEVPYELKDVTKLSQGLWQADFCKKYDGIFNDYQCIRINFKENKTNESGKDPSKKSSDESAKESSNEPSKANESDKANSSVQSDLEQPGSSNVEFKVAMLIIFDYQFDNNKYMIDQDEAINIVKKKFLGDKYEYMGANKEIKLINPWMYVMNKNSEEKENSMPAESTTQNQDDTLYRTQKKVRNIWNVKVKTINSGFEENYFVDGETGEFIGMDQIK